LDETCCLLLCACSSVVDPRRFLQVLMGKPDERLISLQIDRAAALAQM
jgi:hypothetical protein